MSTSLSVEQLRAELTGLGVDSTGHPNQLRGRVKKEKQPFQQQQKQHRFQQQQYKKNISSGRNANHLQQPNRHFTPQQNQSQYQIHTRDDVKSLADSATSWRRPMKEIKSEVKVMAKTEKVEIPIIVEDWKPAYDSYLVLDVEATCERGKLGQPRKASFEFPNEIIEFPVLLLQWRKDDKGKLELHTVDTFHTYVRPVWRPKLSQFCKDLTGISQEAIDAAPSFAEAVDRLHVFLASHGLLEEAQTKQILTRRSKTTSSPPLRRGVSWVSHGPFDLLSFVVKQSYISGLPEGVPKFLRGPLIDVKLSAVEVSKPRWITKAEEAAATIESKTSAERMDLYPFRDTTVDGLLVMLGLGEFQGRHHNGLDDTKNIANIFIKVGGKVAEIAKERDELSNGVIADEDESIGNAQEEMISAASVEKASALERIVLFPNTATENAHMRRWDWMSSTPGQVIWKDEPEI